MFSSQEFSDLAEIRVQLARRMTRDVLCYTIALAAQQPPPGWPASTRPAQSFPNSEATMFRKRLQPVDDTDLLLIGLRKCDCEEGNPCSNHGYSAKAIVEICQSQ
jgi:hypothetical protein